MRAEEFLKRINELKNTVTLYAMPPIPEIITCLNCGKEFNPPPFGNFCSKYCYEDYQDKYIKVDDDDNILFAGIFHCNSWKYYECGMCEEECPIPSDFRHSIEDEGLGRDEAIARVGLGLKETREHLELKEQAIRFLEKNGFPLDSIYLEYVASPYRVDVVGFKQMEEMVAIEVGNCDPRKLRALSRQFTEVYHWPYGLKDPIRIV